MIKGTIQLARGAVVTLECETPQDFAVFINSIGESNVKSAKVTSERKFEETSTSSSKSSRRKRNEWSHNDIIAIGRIVRDNLHLKSGISSLAFMHLRKLGDDKKRPKAVVYSMTSRMKAYLQGEQSALGQNIKDVLANSQVYPKSKEATTNYLSQATRVPVQEA